MNIDLSSLTVKELDDLLEKISTKRVSMEPPISMEAPSQDATIDPSYFISPDFDGTFLQLRHPGYGWLAFLLPPTSRSHILTMLLNHALMGSTKQPDNLVSMNLKPTRKRHSGNKN